MLYRAAARGLPRAVFGWSQRCASSFLTKYNETVAERASQGIVPKPLDAAQVASLVELMQEPPAEEGEELLNLLSQRVPPGVDEAAYVKAGFLAAIVKGEATSPLVTPQAAVHLLGTMQGGYNIQPLVDALDVPELSELAADALSKTILVFDSFHDVEEKAKAGNAAASRVMEAWANADWFTSRPEVAEKITTTVFKVAGETNTDDLSPAPDAWSRPDIPLHALAMLKFPREGITDSQAQIKTAKEKGFPLAYVGDVVGTGSSRKSATNSILWYMGDDLPYIPNKRGGGLCIGGACTHTYVHGACMHACMHTYIRAHTYIHMPVHRGNDRVANPHPRPHPHLRPHPRPHPRPHLRPHPRPHPKREPAPSPAPSP